MSAEYGRALKWPIIGWIAVDVPFVILSYIRGVSEVFTPATLAPLLLAFGVWAGYKIVQFNGGFVDAIVAGVVVGAVCGALIIIGPGIIRGAGVAAVWPLTVFAFEMNLFGAIVGGGYALSK